jgi:hypothetical protein
MTHATCARDRLVQSNNPIGDDRHDRIYDAAAFAGFVTAAPPVPGFDEQRAIDRVASLVAGLLPRMSMRFSHARLAELLRDHLRPGDLVATMKAVVAAERDGDCQLAGACDL